MPARAESAILDAAYALLVERGLEATTIEAIAARAGVSKVTIYKWWPNRAAVIMSAFLRKSVDLLPYPEHFHLEQVEDRLLMMTAAFRGATGTAMAALIAAGQSDPQLAEAFRDGYINARRRDGIAIVRAAVEAGEIRPASPDVVLDLVYAPLYFRLMVGHKPLDEDDVREHVRLVLAALRPA
ncbi:TetR/AcrR family transcriptional regulator [Frankia sp. CNm7]|uniref:TetR/AcrR family transcriptional regulator n=1 Tax=Frankia nepalensis TaxID=1836974 RepID=A0A937R8B3_9ACTN|nr:TetR/AcrR family transcriptional regulator [Frankia nepalensis]MBL7496555.1 TetR/AcrR family transcriptional regulator [Frankia nepalensis]MBL7508774.1 TetR/AcrR family transcriptional regulator [Frankia nepalensis]MBL7520599.1 TetR/AcrR family transcriptional regulator [Frankia nepalensis]MBL7627528.1 TetR/AcrR family transcriptional regulator [Frankia nepalensis]